VLTCEKKKQKETKYFCEKIPLVSQQSDQVRWWLSCS